ncbi:4-alpha-glucanotransferase [Arthrobacter sp. H5]|uniref:4-alpha-glucanotransferase n=1 Tax=Arthrobacter sp. H5 TaxID=1267973 RepID=UPI0004B76985|nr:4-alpha-glucanotransferase [Arthrobacter sp. H5]
MAEFTALQQLAHAHRVGITFRGWDGEERSVTADTLTKVLTALGVPCETDDDVMQSMDDWHLALWHRTLPPAVVVRQDSVTAVPVTVPAGLTPRVWVELEDGSERDVACTVIERRADQEQLSATIPGDLPQGWHMLRVADKSCVLVVTPQRLTTTDRLDRTWGLMVQLYSVRSEKSWGVGDLSDLASLAEVAADKGAGYVLINPLHAAEPKPPVEPSPYLPATRRFLNPLYLRVEEVPEAAGLPLAEVAAQFEDANRNPHVLQRDPGFAAKLQALELAFNQPRMAERSQKFADFCAGEGPGLDRYALWCALAETLPPGAPEWVDEVFAEQQRTVLADRIEFHKWLQWLCDQQLEAAQAAAIDAGMNIGIMHDLAVGVHPAGADAWTLRNVLAPGVSVGAPPDMFNQQGQNWSQPPWHPERLAESGYAAYRDMLRTILRHAGGLRIDHILGLFRLWWIPAGADPGEGAYVYYDSDALIGILALEAERAGAVVVGEDLGVFEPGVQEDLAERGILGTSILWFEHSDAGPRPPEEYRRACLTSVTTHDLPPTAGYLAGEHVDLREELGLLNRPIEEERALDREAQEAVLSLVRSRVPSMPDDGAPFAVQRTVEALHAFIAQTPSLLLGVALTDAVGERRTQNQPGTSDEYPNWRIPLAGQGRAVMVEDLPGNERFESLVRALGPGFSR